MQSALRIGKIGPLTIYLNYTWLIATVIGLWWIALLWLPDNFPGIPTWGDWLIAVVVLLLFLVSVIAHELIHAGLAQSGSRSVNLYPFGSAVPLNLRQLDLGRALRAAAAAPIFNLALGGVLLLLAGTLGEGSFVRALLTPLAWLNLAFGILNFIPGIPLDGGWMLASATSIVTSDREGGIRLARTIGLVTSLLLVLLGAYFGLTSKAWLPALSLVLLGWAMREAGSLGRQRGLIREMFDQIRARDVMDTVRASDIVMHDNVVSEMVSSHPRYAPAAPLPVVDDAGSVLGVTTLGDAEDLLQGTWPTTPVRSIMRPVAALETVRPDSTLSAVMAIREARQSTEQADDHIVVIDGDKMVGSVDPERLEQFAQVGQEFGMTEADTGSVTKGSFGILRAALIPTMVVIAMAILGNLALNTDPADIRDIAQDTTISFEGRTPADGSLVPRGDMAISIQIVAVGDITTATLFLDGTMLESKLEGASPQMKTLTAVASGLAPGTHQVLVRASTKEGAPNSARWSFRTTFSEAETPTVLPSPTTTAQGQLGELPQVIRYLPAIGGRVLAGQEGADAQLGLQVEGVLPPSAPSITLDGTELDSKVSAASGDQDSYLLSATMPALGPGIHQVRVLLGGHLLAWTFSAIEPDANNVYFKETGHFVSQPFLKYWQDNGGVLLFGLPISDLVQETAQGTDLTYTAQYFERARFELAPNNGGAVNLGRLGAILGKPEAAVQPKEGAEFFPPTGHNVSGPFLKFWQENGGLAVFGYPITEERIEKNSVDGKEYTVQYFERNRFELHPEQAGTPFEVQLGRLGAQLYAQKHGP